MYRRALIAAFAALFALPAVASAQQHIMGQLDDPSWMPRLRITPFVGYLTAIERTEEWYGPQSAALIQMNIAGGTAWGLNVDAALLGPFGLSGAFSYAKRGQTIFGDFDTGELTGIDGSHVLTARLGPALYLGEDRSGLAMRRLNAALFAAAVVMVDMPGNDFATADFVDDGVHFGANLGLSAELPFASDRFAVQLGLEDNIMWWDQAQTSSLAHAYFQRNDPNVREVQVETFVDVTHTWLLRAGLSMRFR